MPVVDLGARPDPGPPTSPWDALPRRVGLTRRELEHVAGVVGAPLPFDPPVATVDPTGLSGRLGSHPAQVADLRLEEALAHPADPAAALERRGLLTDGRPEPGLGGALGLLATPDLALDIDVAVDDVRARAWHRRGGGAVATLATTDGVVFELGWCGVDAWPAEIGRVARLPHDLELRRSAVPPVVDLPFELLDAAGEATRTHRSDLVPVLAERYAGSVLADEGRPLDAVQVHALLTALAGETQGRLRVLGSAVDEEARPVGVISWLLLADGWHSLRPHGSGEALRMELRLVAPEDLAGALAPVLAEALS